MGTLIELLGDRKLPATLRIDAAKENLTIH